MRASMIIGLCEQPCDKGRDNRDERRRLDVAHQPHIIGSPLNESSARRAGYRIRPRASAWLCFTRHSTQLPRPRPRRTRKEPRECACPAQRSHPITRNEPSHAASPARNLSCIGQPLENPGRCGLIDIVVGGCVGVVRDHWSKTGHRWRARRTDH